MPPALYSSIERGKPRLRVGLLLNGWKTHAWIADVLHTIRQSEIAEITAIVILPEPDAAPRDRGHRLRRVPGWLRDLNRVLWQLYSWIDVRWHRTFQAPFDDVEIASAIDGAVVIDAGAAARRF